MLFKVKHIHYDGSVSYSEIEASSWDEASQKFDQKFCWGKCRSATLYGQSDLQKFTEFLKKLNCKLESWL